MSNNTGEYVYEDAIEFIHKRLKLSKYIINEVLESELDYMRSLGLVIDHEEDIVND